MVRVHLQDTSEALALTAGAVEHVATLLDRTGVDAEVGQFPYVGIGHNFEDQAGKRGTVACLARNELYVLIPQHLTRQCTGNSGAIKGRGQILHHRVKQFLHALILQSGTTEHGDKFTLDRGLTQTALQFFDTQFFTFEVEQGELIISLGNCFDEIGTCLLRLGEHGLWDRYLTDILAQIIVVDGRPHLQEVDRTPERVFGADRQLDHRRLGPKATDNHTHAALKARAGAIHFVDEADTRNIVLIRLAPNRLGLRLNTSDTIKDHDTTIEDA